jgi:hypothetical protein
MMKGQARSSVGIMGFDTHMILEIVPVCCLDPSPAHPRTGHHATLPGPGADSCEALVTVLRAFFRVACWVALHWWRF